MSKKREKDWIKIVTPENKNMIASPAYVKKLMNLNLFDICNRISSLEYKINKLESPQRQEKIINLLRENGKHNTYWLRNRVYSYQWYDLNNLIKKGIVIETKSGTQTMYEIKDSQFKENEENG